MSKQIKEKYEVYLEAVACLGYGMERIFPEYTAKILAEGVKKSDKELYATRLWEFLLDRQKILIEDYERETRAQAKITAWQEEIGALETKIRDTPRNMHAEHEKLNREIAFIEGKITQFRENMCFSSKWLDYLAKESMAIGKLKEYLNILTETQRLRLSEKYH